MHSVGYNKYIYHIARTYNEKLQRVIKMKLKRVSAYYTLTCKDMKHATVIINATLISSVEEFLFSFERISIQNY